MLNKISELCRSANHAPEDVPEAIGTTLQDLQLDYLDLYLVILVLYRISS
jgi:diketogulonate reductase-like aldo/keto reductase